MVKTKMTKVLVLLVAAAIALTVSSAEAATDTDPDFTLLESHGFQCLLTHTAVTTADCDMLILIRYVLPKDEWRIGAADVAVSTSSPPFNRLMENVVCEDEVNEPFFDLCWTSIFSGVANQTFYNGPRTTATQIAARTLPRVGHGISALYRPAGHGLTFGDTSYEVCIEISSTLFTPADPQCTSVGVWHTVTDTDSDGEVIDDARVTNASALSAIAVNLQAALPGRNELIVTDQYITPTGAIFFAEAYTNWVRAAPGAFAVSQTILDDASLQSGATAAETTIATEAQASQVYTWLSNFNDGHMGGLSMHLVGGALAGIVAIAIGIWIFAKTRSAFIGLVASALVLFAFGPLQDFMDLSLYLVVTLLLFGVGVFGWTKTRI